MHDVKESLDNVADNRIVPRWSSKFGTFRRGPFSNHILQCGLVIK